MDQIDLNVLKTYASKYIWWKTPEEAIAMPERVIAQVMNIGDFDDIQALAHQAGDELLRDVIRHAEAGQFDERSWAYWHYRLGLAELERLPPLPVRSFLQDRPNTLTVLVPASESAPQDVKVSFFGVIGFGRVGEPELTDDGVLLVASLDDLMATKLKVIQQRPEAKDYRDIAAMLDANVRLDRGLASAREMFRPTFQPSESLRALCFFGDGDLHTLTGAEKLTLVNAAGAVRDLPPATVVDTRLGAIP